MFFTIPVMIKDVDFVLINMFALHSRTKPSDAGYLAGAFAFPYQYYFLFKARKFAP